MSVLCTCHSFLWNPPCLAVSAQVAVTVKQQGASEFDADLNAEIDLREGNKLAPVTCATSSY